MPTPLHPPTRLPALQWWLLLLAPLLPPLPPPLLLLPLLLPPLPPPPPPLLLPLLLPLLPLLLLLLPLSQPLLLLLRTHQLRLRPVPCWPIQHARFAGRSRPRETETTVCSCSRPCSRRRSQS